ncbi:MAG: glycosyltransferase [Phycisphaerales bacterium]|nr:glycosyltransferase [Phycisphaerales bacterium]
MSARHTVIFAGGGTGGHLYPALAVSEALEAQHPGKADALFLCSNRPLDATLLEKAGVEFVALPAAPFGIRPGALLRFARSWPFSVAVVRQVIVERKGPVVMVAVGGFVAAPAAWTAKRLRIPLLMLNLDASPGRANRMIERFADAKLTTTPLDRKGFTTIPPIVRTEAIAPGPPALCRERLGLDPGRRTLLVVGGSQGAKSLNAFVAAFVREHADALEGWQILHQSGDRGDEGAAEAMREAGVAGEVRAYLDEIGAAWGAADLALSRAGAGGVAEAWANAVPTLFAPYPYHKDQHQALNARRLADAGAAVVAEDRVEPGQNLQSLGEPLLRLLTDDAARDAMRQAAKELGPADGASKVAEAVGVRLGL